MLAVAALTLVASVSTSLTLGALVLIASASTAHTVGALAFIASASAALAVDASTVAAWPARLGTASRSRRVRSTAPSPDVGLVLRRVGRHSYLPHQVTPGSSGAAAAAVIDIGGVSGPSGRTGTVTTALATVPSSETVTEPPSGR